MIIGIGETVLDIIFKNEQPVKAVPGGSTFNAMISIGRTGTSCTMATEVGDDHVGDIVANFLHDNGVQTDYVFRHKGTQTHVSLAFLNEQNDAQYAFYKDHAAYTMDCPMPEVHYGDMVLYGSYFAINPNLRDYVSTFLNKAKEAGATLYYDINFRKSHVKDLPMVKPFIKENMKLATVVRGSAEDFQILYGIDNAKEVYEQHIKALCPNFIYTNAADPIEVFTPYLYIQHPAKPIQTVSTIGAGDNFNAGFCYALHKFLNEDKKGIKDDTLMPMMSKEEWGDLIAMGQRFSSEVCQSFDNYISKPLVCTLVQGSSSQSNR